jgi:hypothetical protein
VPDLVVGRLRVVILVGGDPVHGGEGVAAAIGEQAADDLRGQIVDRQRHLARFPLVAVPKLRAQQRLAAPFRDDRLQDRDPVPGEHRADRRHDVGQAGVLVGVRPPCLVPGRDRGRAGLPDVRELALRRGEGCGEAGMLDALGHG